MRSRRLPKTLPPGHPVLVLYLTLAGQAFSQGVDPVLREVAFSHTQDVGYGNEVCVFGAHPQLGGGDPRRAVKLAWTAGNVWQGTIALPAGEHIAYRFIARDYHNDPWKDTNALTYLTGEQVVEVPAHRSAPWPGKTVFLHSTLAQAVILYRDLATGGDWTNVPMTRVGDGRVPGESLFRADGLASVGKDIEFVFHDGAGTWINAIGPPANTNFEGTILVPKPYQDLLPPYNFRTHLDVFFVQDRQVFAYRPPTEVSPPRVETRDIQSTVAGIPGRTIRIRLPRGYDSQTEKRYPVVYFHDGDVVFYWDNIWTWDADRIAWYETLQGRMRETILVTIPKGNALGSSRNEEYLPESDNLAFIHYGRADDYLAFLLTNVIPTLDTHYRTLGDAAHTMVAGSSLGGLVSDYIGYHRSDRFGTVGIFSPAYWAAPNFMQGRSLARLPLRRFLYMGTEEVTDILASRETYWRGVLAAWDSYLNLGHPAYDELVFIGGPDAVHSQPDWSDHLDDFFHWALDPWLEPQTLAAELFPPELWLASSPEAPDVIIGYGQRRGYDHLLEQTTDLNSDWVEQPVPGPDDPWGEALAPASPMADSLALMRLKLKPPHATGDPMPPASAP